MAKKIIYTIGYTTFSINDFIKEIKELGITCIVDVHRDDITYENKTKVKPTAIVNGKKPA